MYVVESSMGLGSTFKSIFNDNVHSAPVCKVSMCLFNVIQSLLAKLTIISSVVVGQKATPHGEGVGK